VKPAGPLRHAESDELSLPHASEVRVADFVLNLNGAVTPAYEPTRISALKRTRNKDFDATSNKLAGDLSLLTIR
jgi:hypothetical protein